jgi:hypothetical protein
MGPRSSPVHSTPPSRPNAVVKSGTPTFAARSPFFEWRAPVWPLSRAAELLALPDQIFARRATGCLSAVQTFVSTTPLALEPNLRTILDPAGLLRGQSPLATTTKIHRQLAVFPNSHTYHDPRNNRRQPPLPWWLRGPPTYIVYHHTISPFRKA